MHCNTTRRLVAASTLALGLSLSVGSVAAQPLTSESHPTSASGFVSWLRQWVEEGWTLAWTPLSREAHSDGIPLNATQRSSTTPNRGMTIDPNGGQ